MRFIFTVLLGVVLGGFCYGQEFKLVGKLPAPAMVLTDMAGNKIDTREFAGKTVVYNLWYVGCPPCMDEIPRLNAIVDANPDVIFVGMSSSNAADITKFIAKQPFKYRLVPDSAKSMLIYFGNATKDGVLNVGFPTHVVINKEGYIEFRAVGLKGVEGVKETLARLAAKK